MSLAEQYRAGMTIEQIALDAGVATRAVNRRLWDEGVQMRKPGERPNVERRPGARPGARSNGDLQGPREPDARIVRPSVQRYYR